MGFTSPLLSDTWGTGPAWRARPAGRVCSRLSVWDAGKVPSDPNRQPQARAARSVSLVWKRVPSPKASRRRRKHERCAPPIPSAAPRRLAAHLFNPAQALLALRRQPLPFLP